jgi:hypothetical protein
MGTNVTIPGLLTGRPYWVRVQAVNGDGPLNGGQLSPFSSTVTTTTYNGGAPLGSLAGTLSALGASQFTGSLGDGTFVTLRSAGGSFTTDTTVTISTYDVSAGGHGALCPNGVINSGGLTTAFEITDSPAFQPNRPIFLTASYSPSEITGPVTQVSLSRYDPVSGTCAPLETVFNAAVQSYTAQLNHFSLYQLVQVPLATSADSARVFPNPYRAATDGFVTIDHVPPTSRVRVMTLRGETIMDTSANGSGLVTWAATNGSGRPVASGLYLVVVEGGGSQKITKLAVIR